MTAGPQMGRVRLAISLVLGLAALIPVARAGQGGQIVFHSRVDDNTDIYVVDADGTNVRRLTDDPAGDSSPRWSPGGSRIAFTSDRGGVGNVYVMDATGGNVRRVTEDPAFVSWPAWSPDGQKIAFYARYQEYGIHIIDRDGHNVRFVTGVPVAKQFPGNHFQESYGGMDWSPDGRTLIFNAHSKVDVGSV